MTEDIKQYWFLVSGEVIYEEPQEKGDPLITSTRLNGIIKGNEANIPVSGIAKAQQVLQVNFHKLNQNKFKVVGVVLYAVSSLGLMTEKEFNNFNPEPKEESK